MISNNRFFERSYCDYEDDESCLHMGGDRIWQESRKKTRAKSESRRARN